MFENLLQELLVNKPDKPLDFLINALQMDPGKQPTISFTNRLISVRRVFLMGPPGSFRQENAGFLSDKFEWKCIATGALLQKEVLKKSEVGKKISDAWKSY